VSEQPDLFGGTSRVGRRVWRSVRLPPDLVDHLDDLAEERGSTFATALRQVLVAGLSSLGRGPGRW
jgi:hypothetical protein